MKGEDEEDAIGRLFLAYPDQVLCAMQSQQDIVTLAGDIYEGAGEWKEVNGVPYGDYTKVWPAIHQLEHNRDARIAGLARHLDKAFQPGGAS